MKNRFFSSLLDLIYPSTCLICESELSRFEKSICSICDENLLLTNFQHFNEPTELDQLFWGRTPLEFTYSHLFFRKNSSSQTILFSLKYKNNPDLGVYFGEQIGMAIEEKVKTYQIDAILPVPLNHRKQFKRGYNQSQKLAEGISNKLNIPINEKLLQRTQNNVSQTKKSRFQRWDNVSSSFEIKDLKTYKHILIVDDVATTGATIEHIIILLKEKAPDLKISVVTLAIA